MKADLTFEQYIINTKKCIIDNKLKHNAIGVNIRSLSINDDFVDANLMYFREQYDCGYNPESVLAQIETDIYELYVKMDDVSDDYFINEVNNRNLGRQCIAEVNTDDIELELESRCDTTYRDINSLTRDELLEELGITEDDIIIDDFNAKGVICKVLGFPNSFAYSTDEIIDEIRKRLK